jgi:hypothetical protein
MSKLISLLGAIAVNAGCAPSVPLTRSEFERLRGTASVPAVHVLSRTPEVDCPGDWGEQTWSAPGGDVAMGPAAPSTILRAGYAPARKTPVIRAGSLWEDAQAQRTESLRNAPPRDPALVTRDGFLSFSAREVRPVPFTGNAAPMKSGDRRALERRFGNAPVLVFETTRWVLVGCFYTYQPWFNVRATLIEAGSGRVLWRETCGGLYPPDPFADASPAELEGNGKALYARMIDERAQRCAEELFTSFIRVQQQLPKEQVRVRARTRKQQLEFSAGAWTSQPRAFFQQR